VGWYFVPFANLIKPYQAMRELWHASMGTADVYSEEAPSRIKLWWAFWIIGNIVSNISERIALAADDAESFRLAATIGLPSSALTIACAWMLLGLTRDITSAQQSGIGAAQVFE
jgi:hypothetical protein